MYKYLDLTQNLSTRRERPLKIALAWMVLCKKMKGTGDVKVHFPWTPAFLALTEHNMENREDK